jgi:serine/threonine protein kinase
VLQACEALAEAHALGIVHRDLKPANLFLTARADGSPCVKVLDFGISKIAAHSGSGSDMGMTRTQSIMGSPLYMSPEQMASARDVDQRSDVWAIGTVLYELVTGRVPFQAETMPQLCTLILHAEPPPPRSVRPELPEAIERVILRCLRKDRAHRYQNVAMLARDLATFAPDAGPRSAERISKVLSSSGISLGDVGAANAQSQNPAANTASQAWGTTHTARSNRAVWFGLGGAAVLVAGGLLIWKATSSVPSVSPDVSAAAALPKPPTEAAPTPAPPVAPPVVTPAAPAASVAAPAPASASASASSAPPKPAPKGVRPKAAPGKPDTVDPLSERN